MFEYDESGRESIMKELDSKMELVKITLYNYDDKDLLISETTYDKLNQIRNLREYF
jgi:hypothetical protein